MKKRRRIPAGHALIPTFALLQVTSQDSNAALPSLPSHQTEPNSMEQLILHSVPGHTLAEIRELLQQHSNDSDAVIEVLLAQDAEDERELERSSPVALKSRDECTPASLPPVVNLQPHDAVIKRPDHLRQDLLRDWRADSPSSVDTAPTPSSTDGGSVSTVATSDQADSNGPPSDDGRRRLRSAKRSANSEAMTASLLREAVRPRSQTPPGIRELAEESRQLAVEDSSAAQSEETGRPTSTRGRGRGRGSARAVPTARQKRDTARARRHERDIARAAERKAQALGTSTEKATASQPKSSEMRSFVELRI